jgi:hypothetical protein
VTDMTSYLNTEHNFVIVGIAEGEDKPMRLAGSQGIAGITLEKFEVTQDRATLSGAWRVGGQVKFFISTEALRMYIGHTFSDAKAVSLLLSGTTGQDNVPTEIHVSGILVREERTPDSDRALLTLAIYDFKLRTKRSPKKPSEMLVEL